jgi:uncharacterized protein (DUF488 family)
MNRLLKLPKKTARERAESKVLFNEARSLMGADFFTVGYEGRSLADLVELFRTARVQSVLDIRYTPLSMYRPELSKANFQRSMEVEGFDYLHVPELGVPRDVRAKAIAAGTREPIWDWYNQAVVNKYFKGNLHWFLNLGYPVAMMCVEADPKECHRHCLFNALEMQGLRGFDL